MYRNNKKKGKDGKSRRGEGEVIILKGMSDGDINKSIKDIKWRGHILGGNGDVNRDSYM